jgi:TonB family protein
VEETNPEVAPPEDKQDTPPEGPPDLGLGAGDGPGGFGPSGNGTGGTGTGTGSSQNRSRFGRYAGQVQMVISSALQQNARTRSAGFSIRVAIWADSTGRVSRVKLLSTSGDPAVDQAIQNEVLTGLQLSEAPPEGMPMPIQLRLNATKRKGN